MSRDLFKALAPLARRIRLLAGRAVLTLIDDATKMQGVQVRLLDGEACDRVDRLQQYGFTSVPHPGAEGIYLALGGSRDHGVVIVADDRRYRLKNLAGGEVAMYSDEGDSIVFKRGRTIEVTTQTLELASPTVNMTGSLNVAGNIIAQGDIADHGNKSMLGMREVYNAHTHPGGPANPPNPGM